MLGNMKFKIHMVDIKHTIVREFTPKIPKRQTATLPFKATSKITNVGIKDAIKYIEEISNLVQKT